MFDRWRHRLRHRITPSEQRVLDRKEHENLRSKGRFRTLMGYILKRKERWVLCFLSHVFADSGWRTATPH